MKITLNLEEDMLVVEVDSEGNFEEAQVYSVLFDCFLDCTDWVRNSDFWQKKIAIAYEDYMKSLKERDWTGEENLDEIA